MNEASGRMIQIGKGTYNKLLREGYQVDTRQGVMTPPGARASARAATSPRRPSAAKAKQGASASSPGTRASGLSSASGMPLPDD